MDTGFFVYLVKMYEMPEWGLFGVYFVCSACFLDEQYRLSLSSYADNFILKGGMLLYTILGNDARATQDIDFLARRLNNQLKIVILYDKIECDVGMMQKSSQNFT